MGNLWGWLRTTNGIYTVPTFRVALFDPTYKVAGHCRRYANLRPDKTGDCKVEYGVCLSAATSGIFGDAGVGVSKPSD